jgi:hypothetical protein
MSFHVGVDVGQFNDYTAVSVVEDVGDEFLHLRHLERYPLRTLYPDMAEKIASLARELKRMTGRPARLVVDRTGVGPAITDPLTKLGVDYRGVTITGGEETSYKDGSYRVPKRDLVAALEIPFHSGTLKVAEGLALWSTLREELLKFRRKINLKTAHDSYEHWRESDHDDLVLATALACWSIKGVAPSIALAAPLDMRGDVRVAPMGPGARRYGNHPEEGGHLSFPLSPPPNESYREPR